jgi:mersacidin/lichenicidin family type 2 lantibiotic
MDSSAATSTHPLVRIYLARAFDPVILAARGVALDVGERPHAYQHLPEAIAHTFSDFRTYSGKHPEWPDAAQRIVTVRRTLGRFYVSFAGIRRSAMSLAESASRRGELVARSTLAEEAMALRAAVAPLEGEELEALAAVETGLLRRAETVLTSQAVAAAFGAAEVSGGGWPDGGLYSAQLAYLCEQVSRRVAIGGVFFQPRLSLIQRAAHHGAVTLATVLDPSFDPDDEDRVDAITQSASSWAEALGGLLFRLDVVRAWTDPSYRNRLLSLEQDILPPNPAGEIDLEGTNLLLQSRMFVQAAGTWTVSHEICCSSSTPCGSNGSDCASTFDECPTLIIAPPDGGS